MLTGYFGDAGGSEGFNSPGYPLKGSGIDPGYEAQLKTNSLNQMNTLNHSGGCAAQMQGHSGGGGSIPRHMQDASKEKPLATSPVDTSLSELYAGLKHLAGIVEHLEQRLAPVLTPAPKTTAGEGTAQQDGNGDTCPLIMEIRTASDRLGGLIQRVDTIRLRLCI